MEQFREGSQLVDGSSTEAIEQEATVRRFYEDFGWTKTDSESNEFQDTALFTDPRALASAYYAAAFARVERPIEANRGGLFLDAGSGPVPGDQLVRLAHGYDRRVCVDIAHTALREARRRLGDAGLYVQADICSLPFPDGTFSTALSAHAIYHIPRSRQLAAFGALLRATRPGGVVAVIHSVSAAPVTRAASLAGRLLRRLARRQVVSDVDTPPPLYYDPLPYGDFVSHFGGEHAVEATVYRLLPGHLIRRFPDNRVGKLGLRLLTVVEDRLPHLSLRLAKYQLLIAHPASAAGRSGGATRR